jgi:hypothetical protein
MRTIKMRELILQECSPLTIQLGVVLVRHEASSLDHLSRSLGRDFLATADALDIRTRGGLHAFEEDGGHLASELDVVVLRKRG